jgi:hypothetical protein
MLVLLGMKAFYGCYFGLVFVIFRSLVVVIHSTLYILQRLADMNHTRGIDCIVFVLQNRSIHSNNSSLIIFTFRDS